MTKKKAGRNLRNIASQAPIRKIQSAAEEASKKPLKSDEPKQPALTKKIGLLMFFFAFMIYAQSLKYNFTLDDKIVIFENSVTTQGIKAIPTIFANPYLYGSVLPDNRIYRPISKAVFAFCWSVSPGNPMVFHLVNVLFFALTGLMLFLTLKRYFPENLFVPLISTLMFIVHPIHTEVVDNIKSLDEILCFMFFIISLYFIYSYLNKKKIMFLLIAAFSFFISFLSKESGITFLAVFPLIAYFTCSKKKEIIKITGAMVLVAVLVFVIRFLVLSVSNSISIPTSPADNILTGTDNFLIQRATAIYLTGKYLLLLIFPHPLVCDYSPQQLSLIQSGDGRFLLSSLLLLSLIIFSVIRCIRRDWIGFGIIFFLITFSVTSNLFFLGGNHFAERFMYAPSLGFCLVFGVLSDRLLNKQKETIEKMLSVKKMLTGQPFLFLFIVAVFVSFVIKTMIQNPVWKDDIALFENGVKRSPKSYRVHIALAYDLTDKKYLEKFGKEEQEKITSRAINEIKTGLTFFTKIDGYDMLGNIYYVNDQYDSACYYYQRSLSFRPDDENFNYHMGKVLDKLEKYDEAILYLNKAFAKNPKNDGVLFNLGLSYTNKGDMDKGLKYFLRINELNPDRADAYYYAGLIYNAKGDKIKGKQFLDKATALGGLTAK